MSTDELVIKRLQQQVRATIEVTSGQIARLEAENRALRATMTMLPVRRRFSIFGHNWTTKSVEPIR